MDWAVLNPQIERFLSSIGAIATGYLLAKGIDEATALAIGAGVAAALIVGWGALMNRTNTLIATAAKQPGVDEIVVETQKQANAIPDPKVVAR